MFWILESMEPRDDAPSGGWAGQWVLHHHRDADGPHLDLRLEAGGVLAGLRIDGNTLEPGVRAVEKGPHPAAWLRAAGELQVAGRGRWGWESREPARRALVLDDGRTRRLLAWTRLPALPIVVATRLVEWCDSNGVAPERLPDLCADGMRARRAALARCRGLAALLEGHDFDPEAWNALLEPLDLEGLNARLEALEARVDRQHPPIPWTRPADGSARPPEIPDPRALARAMALLRDDPAPEPGERTARPRGRAVPGA
ncbi:MAG TPA: hypothetical protein PK379_11270 [Candidatus Hydrogenedentes bacterium]|nr:hypothetical protein [Candidatus Hydrogenedentota bacterium]